MTDPISTRRLRTSFDARRERKRVERLLARGVLEAPNGALTVARATLPEELREAYALVHTVFVRQGYIAPSPRGMRIRVYELLPETCTFVARLDGKLVGVMSVVPDSVDLGLPSDSAFRAELDSLRDKGRRVVEITNLAVRDELRNTSVFLELARAMTAHGIEQGYDDAFVAISPAHAAFFEGILRFEPWGHRRAYDPCGVDWVQGNRCDIRRFESELLAVDAKLGDRAFLHRWFFEQNPRFASSSRGRTRRELAPDALRALLDEPAAWLARLSPRERRALGQRWKAAG